MLSKLYIFIFLIWIFFWTFIFSSLYRVFEIYKSEILFQKWASISRNIYKLDINKEEIANYISKDKIYQIWSYEDIKKYFHNKKYCWKYIYFFYKENADSTEISWDSEIIKRLMDPEYHLFLYRCSSPYIYFHNWIIKIY